MEVRWGGARNGGALVRRVRAQALALPKRLPLAISEAPSSCVSLAGAALQDVRPASYSYSTVLASPISCSPSRARGEPFTPCSRASSLAPSPKKIRPAILGLCDDPSNESSCQSASKSLHTISVLATLACYALTLLPCSTALCGQP